MSVYFRSSNNLLPDVVIDLHGQVEIELVGRIDSVKGAIRTTFENVPDASATKFVLRTQGGKKGLIVNNRDLCARKLRAEVKLSGQNGRAHNTTPVVQSNCKKKR